MKKPPENLLATRKTLLSRLRNWDDQDSWQDFFDTYWKLIYGFATGSGLTDSEAEDVLQETMLAVAKHMPGFKYDPAIGSFKNWLLHTTQWRIWDCLRKRERDSRLARQLTEEQALIEQPPSPDALAAAEWNRLWSEHLLEAGIERVKKRVSPRQFQMFHLYALKTMPVPEVVKRLGVSRTQVYLAKHRIQRLLAREMRRLDRQIL